MKSRLAQAKINLALHVTGKRDDGYHLLDTLVCFASPVSPHACDEVRMETAARDSFSISGPGAADLANTQGNLILDALEALRRRGHGVPPVRVELVKNLPVASGIGGGSADAAAALHLANELLPQPLDASALSEVAASLGADVPMCLHGQPLRATGIGEELTPVALPQLHMVLVNPRQAVSTPTVFKALNTVHHAPMAPLPSACDNWTSWLAGQRNDLQEAAMGLCPPIGHVLDALNATPHLELARMSGSGATCFGLYPSAADARRAADALATAHPDWWSVALQTEPSPGAL